MNGGVSAFSILSDGRQQSILYSKMKMIVLRFCPRGDFLACEQIDFDNGYDFTKAVYSDQGGNAFTRHCTTFRLREDELKLEDAGDGKVCTLVTYSGRPNYVAVLGETVIVAEAYERRLRVFTKAQLKNSKTNREENSYKLGEIAGVFTIDLTINGCWNQPEKSAAALSACSQKFILSRMSPNEFSLDRIVS